MDRQGAPHVPVAPHQRAKQEALPSRGSCISGHSGISLVFPVLPRGVWGPRVGPLLLHSAHCCSQHGGWRKLAEGWVIEAADVVREMGSCNLEAQRSLGARPRRPGPGLL